MALSKTEESDFISVPLPMAVFQLLVHTAISSHRSVSLFTRVKKDGKENVRMICDSGICKSFIPTHSAVERTEESSVLNYKTIHKIHANLDCVNNLISRPCFEV